ncbi:(R)-2-hydroxyisocaproyl-CoA dehydratase beta subunit [subsurface metagenome]
MKYFKLELLDLKKQLEEITGTKIDNQDLMDSIKKYNIFKKKILEISNLTLNGSQKLKIFQKAMLYGPVILPELDNIILEQSQTQKSEESKDILLTGCSIFIGDYLNDLIEEGGGNVVFFDTWVGFNYYYQIIDEKLLNASKDSIDLLVHRFEKNIYGDHSVPNFLERKVSHIENFSINYEKKTGKKIGVINHIIKFCDHMSIMSSHLKNQLKEKGIYVLNLERDYSRANRGQLSTRIEAFLEMM